MTELSRRRLLTGAATAAAATAMGLPFASAPARAAAPATGRQAPAFYRTKVGDFEVTQIADGARTFPMPDGFVRNVPKEQALAAAEAAYMPRGMVTDSVQSRGGQHRLQAGADRHRLRSRSGALGRAC